MTESFIFYKSFYVAASQAPDDATKRDILWHLVEVCLGIKTVNDIPFPASAVAVQALASVESAKQRYGKAVEDGKKGGRPTKREFISPDVWIKAIEEHGSIPKAAKALGLAKQTLYNWALASNDPRIKNSPIVQKSKNLNVYVNDNESVSVSESVYDNDSEKRNINNAKMDANAAGGFNSPTAPAPRKNKNLVTDPFLEMMRREIGIDKYEFGTGRVKKKDGEDEAK